MPESVNLFDATVIFIFGLSCTIAFFRGFIREVLSLFAWLGAAIITLYLFPHSTDYMKNRVNNEHVAAGLGALGTYVAALITISIINAVIIRYVKSGKEVGLLDNFLGLLFGAMRGAFVVSLGFVILNAFIPADNPPQWLSNSFTQPYLIKSGEVITQVAPGYLGDLKDAVKVGKSAAHHEEKNIHNEVQEELAKTQKDSNTGTQTLPVVTERPAGASTPEQQHMDNYLKNMQGVGSLTR